MCGIHGIFNKSTFGRIDLKEWIADAFVVNTLRGVDSAGVFQIDKDNAPFMHKQNVPGFMFVETKTVKRFLDDVPSCPVTVGHVRAATAGKVTVDNAHPFVAERKDGSRVVGVHNGTITNWKTFADHKDYEVDSEWALNQIANEGTDAFEKFCGSYCFVWWDEKTPNKMYMVRNDDRPMHFLFNKAKDTMFFASEAGMATWLCERRKIEMDETIYSLDPHKMYTFDLSGKNAITWKKVNVPKYKYVSTASTTDYSGNRRSRWNAQRGAWEAVGTTGNVVPVQNGNLVDEFDEDDIYGGMGYPYGPQSSREGARGGSTEVNSFPASGAAFLNRVKHAIADNRTRRDAAARAAETSKPVAEKTASTPVAKKPVTLVANPPKLSKREQRRLRAAARAAHKKANTAGEAKKPAATADANRSWIDKNGEYVAPANWYSTETATSFEQQEAKSSGVMGQIEWLTGVIYEPETGELYGDIQEYLPGNGKITHTGIVRGLSAHAAKSKWVDNKGQWCVIIGIVHDNHTKEPMFVVSELTEAGKESMKKSAA